MKIGKTKYLSLLDFTSSFDAERSLIIQPLVKVYEDIKNNSDQRINEFEERLKKEPDEDWDMGMTSHTFLYDQIEDLSFEFSLQRDAVATSLILVAQSYLHSKFQNIVSTYEYFRKWKGFKDSFNINDLRNYYFSLGNKVNGVAWAEGVKSGSNYARHFEEWNVSSTAMKRLPTGEFILEKVTNLISKLDKKQQGTAQTLLNLGFQEEEVFDKRNNLAQNIVDKLTLNNPNEFSKNTSVWLDEVMKDLHRKFDSFDN